MSLCGVYQHGRVTVGCCARAKVVRGGTAAGRAQTRVCKPTATVRFEMGLAVVFAGTREVLVEEEDVEGSERVRRECNGNVTRAKAGVRGHCTAMCMVQLEHACTHTHKGRSRYTHVIARQPLRLVPCL